MPNNKKKRKNKEKKRTSTASAAAASTARALYPPSHVLFPLGQCLHTLQRDECNLPEMYEYIRGYHQILENRGDDVEYLRCPDNANERTVRLLFHAAVKFILEHKSHPTGTFSTIIRLYGVIKCGSHDAVMQAISYHDVFEVDAMMALLDENQVSFIALRDALYYMKQDSYYGLVYVLNELAPCDCLQAELEHAKQDNAEAQGQREMFCFNPACQEKQESDCNASPYRCCAGCKMAQYCSSHCYHVHWRGTIAASGISHKIACNAIQEFVAFLGGGGGGGGGGEAFGNDDSC